MIRTLLLSSALSFVVASAAFAADLPTTKGEPVYAPPPAPVFTWTGFYIGVNGGVGAGDVKRTFNDTEGASFTDFSGGGLAGGTVGFNYEWPGSNFVTGVEGDFDWASIRAGANESFPAYSEGYGSDIQWLATARVRIGYSVMTPFGNLLPYVTGGGAFGQVKDYQWYSDVSGCGGGFDGNCSYTHSWVGWTAGAGLEYAITQNLTFKAEYLYVDLGNHDISNEYQAPSGYANEHVTANVVRAGLNWKFDWFAPPPPAPVVAKY